jgi:excisionase family DNA binding protein
VSATRTASEPPLNIADLAGETEVLTVAQAANRLAVSTDTVERWIRAGHLPAFVRPGLKPGQRHGKTTYRIFLADWQAFLRRQTVRGVVAAPVPNPVVVASAAVETGTDGISRLDRKRKPRG